MIDDFNLYKDYLSTKKHLEQKGYDVLKDPIVNVPKSRYEESRSYGFIRRLAKQFDRRKDGVNYIIPCLVYNENLFVPFEQGRQYLTKWQGIQEALSYNFEEDLKVIQANLGGLPNMFSYEESGLPPFLELQLQGKINIETSTILLNYFCGDKKAVENCPQIKQIWKKEYIKTLKCNSFIGKNVEKMRIIYEKYKIPLDNG